MWLANPVTQNFLECLKFSQDEVFDQVAKGNGFDIANNDKTCNVIYFNSGLKEGYRISSEVTALLEKYEMVEMPQEDPDA